LAEKVRFLPYEEVTRIEHFFGDRGEGLNVDVFGGRAEKLSA